MDFVKTKQGTELPLILLKGKPYLQVMHRLIWFREEHPDWQISTAIHTLEVDFAIAFATVRNEKGDVMATAHKQEHRTHFPDFIEKAETGAIGRALGLVGYGTQFAVELDEEDRIVDSPVPPPQPRRAGPPSSSPAAAQKVLPNPSSLEKSKPVIPPLPTGTPLPLPNPSSSSVGNPATPSPSPFAKGTEKGDLKRDQLNNKLANLYRPYLAKFPNAHFTEILKERYKVDETKLMTTAQISDLVTFMEEGINVTPPTLVKTGKPPTDTERKDLWEASKSNGWTAAQMTLYLKAAFKVASSKTLSREQFQLLSSVSPCTPFEIAYAEVAPQEDMP